MIKRSWKIVGNIPDIFADGYAQTLSLEVHPDRPISRFKVALLIENVIRGKQPLMSACDQFAVGKEKRRVVIGLARSIFIFGHNSANHSNARACLLDPRPIPPARPDEARLVEEIPGWIPDEGHFGKDHQVTPFVLGLFDRITNLVGIPREIPDIWVDLY
jgi:hypothetical protein